MKKKSIRNVSIGVGVIILIGLIAYFGVLNSFYPATYPALTVSQGRSEYCCGGATTYCPPAWLGYASKDKVYLLNSVTDADNLFNNNNWEDWEEFASGKPTRVIRTGGSVSSYGLQSGVPPQVKCDGTKNCNYEGNTGSNWILNSTDNLCYNQDYVPKKISLYRFENNVCSNYQDFLENKKDNDYLTLAECESKVTVQRVCDEGKTIKGECPDGSQITTSICKNNMWNPQTTICSDNSQPEVIDGQTDEANQVAKSYSDYLLYLIPLAVLGIFVFAIIKIRKKR